MNNPLLSIVIPTKERYPYLIKLLQLIYSFNNSDIEVIVQDNTENDNLHFTEFMQQSNMSSLKYFRTKEKLTSIQNFDKAIFNATGEYVCFIGDDDGVCRNIVECAKWMKYNGIEAVLSQRSYYKWPCHSDKGQLVVGYSRKTIEYLNPIEELVKILKSGCDNLGNIPVTYTGIVQKKILDRIYEDFGSYFPGGASADIANGVALCFYVKRFVKLNFPIVITGTSIHTGGSIIRTKFIPFKDIPFISDSVGAEWEGDFPQYWFGCFVWPESAIKCLRALGKEAFIPYLNYDKIFAHAIIRAKAKPSIYYKYRSPIKLHYYILQSSLRRFCCAVCRRISHYLFIKTRYSNINDIVEAENILNTFSKDFHNINY